MGELTQCMSYHLRCYLNIDEILTVVNSNCDSYHLGQNVHTTAVGLDDPTIFV